MRPTKRSPLLRLVSVLLPLLVLLLACWAGAACGGGDEPDAGGAADTGQTGPETVSDAANPADRSVEKGTGPEIVPEPGEDVGVEDGVKADLGPGDRTGPDGGSGEDDLTTDTELADLPPPPDESTVDGGGTIDGGQPESTGERGGDPAPRESGRDGLVVSGPGTLTGSVSGVTVSPIRGVVLIQQRGVVMIAITDLQDICKFIPSAGGPPAPYAVLVLGTLTPTAGTYSIGGASSALAQFVYRRIGDPKETEVKATGGQFVLSSLNLGSNPSVEGTFDLTFGSDRVKGTFRSKVECNTGGSPPTDAGPPPPPPDVGPPPPPPPPQCMTDADCGIPSCRESGGICYQVEYKCYSGQCLGSAGQVPGASCDPSTGRCI